MPQQYYNQNSLLSLAPIAVPSQFKLLTTDTYNESMIWDSIQKTGEEQKLLCSAIQTAIVGTGNKVVGSMLYNDIEIPLSSFYQSVNVNTMLTINSKIEPGELTVRRLQRFFRYHIKKYLEDHTAVYSYLYKKFSIKDEKYRTICFPGAEHMVENKDEAHYLYDTYKRLDHRAKASISERIQRVLIARGVCTLLDFAEFDSIFIAKLT